MKSITIFLFIALTTAAQLDTGIQIARLKYDGGGDWYNDPSAEVNLLNFVEANTNINTSPNYTFVEIGSDDIFTYPFLFMTGHGNIVFSSSDAERLREYLTSGGFLYVDDDYGLDNAFRREIKKVFPDKDLVELPFDYGLYHCLYDFNYGPPKIHEHDNNPPQGFGIFIDGRLAVYYTYESNPGDGWTDQRVHNTPEEKRQAALKFGANLIVWALSN
ncbi:MAG: DUF4159 domain-containing protein [Melioribacteraceae bacterium]|nr:DUF4159 domain-containing protein [Melioribacteraceae bacterium]